MKSSKFNVLRNPEDLLQAGLSLGGLGDPILPHGDEPFFSQLGRQGLMGDLTGDKIPDPPIDLEDLGDPRPAVVPRLPTLVASMALKKVQIGRASCRERV